MAEKVLMLALSPTMETGTIAKWTAKEGDTVDSGDVDRCPVSPEKPSERPVLVGFLPAGDRLLVEGDGVAVPRRACHITPQNLKRADSLGSGFRLKLVSPYVEQTRAVFPVE